MKVKVNDVELYYEQHGQGDPVIFIHGWLDDHSVWDSQVKSFSPKHSVVTYDHRGHGDSGKPTHNYSIQTLANDLHSLMQHLNIEKATLIGHSMGGFTAMTFTLDHADKVSSLVLVCTTARMSIMTRCARFLFLFVPHKLNGRISIMFKYHRTSQEMVDNVLRMAKNVPKYAAIESYRELATRYDMRNRVSQIKVPTLIVAGEKDRGTPASMSRYLHGQIEGSQLHVIPDCAHMPMIEKPDELNQILEEFIV
jgi:pimeloyl-ACP methyl ester carboxylesterase